MTNQLTAHQKSPQCLRFDTKEEQTHFTFIILVRIC